MTPPPDPGRATALDVLAGGTDEPRTLLSLVILVLGTALTYWALDHPRWEVPAVALAAVGVTSWTLTNAPYEGAVLFIPFKGNGLTAADLLCGPALVLGTWLSWRAVRR